MMRSGDSLHQPTQLALLWQLGAEMELLAGRARYHLGIQRYWTSGAVTLDLKVPRGDAVYCFGCVCVPHGLGGGFPYTTYLVYNIYFQSSVFYSFEAGLGG